MSADIGLCKGRDQGLVKMQGGTESDFVFAPSCLVGDAGIWTLAGKFRKHL